MKRRRLFSLMICALAVLGARVTTVRAQDGAHPPTWGHARIVQRSGHAIFTVDGEPFFLYGAAFFYERLPRDEWDASMTELADMGINTLDLYVPWNWHELADGDFDFTGRTSSRRDFDEVLRLAKRHGFEIVLRPGPVIRNEWRNGGYPAWLLQRPEYDMPLHDILEGRYPSTATLQNQHSDDAAREWMRNATHMKYSKRWLERVLAECAPYADRIMAVALDDDQGAYIDNQTYPAPHFQAYLGWLRDVVHGVTGPNELTFINTYQMKVPASSPVWAMGNWYQSDAYAIGMHDEAQLAFSFAELATRPNQPLFASEFQAGWLQGAGEAYPRAADPSNTALALATMFGTGVRGVVNFPAQDTLDPTGWEAPFANFAYAWDAALRLDASAAARYAPTAAFGALVASLGPTLAASYPRYDASIVYAGGNVAPGETVGTTYAQIASATIDAQQACRNAGFACGMIDLSALDLATIPRDSLLLVPTYDRETLRAIDPSFGRALARVRALRHVRVARIATEADVRRGFAGRRAIVDGVDDAVFSETTDGRVAGFLSVSNYARDDRSYANASVTLSSGRRIALAPFVVRAHSAIVAPIDVRRSPAIVADVRDASGGRPSPEASPTRDEATVVLRPGFALPQQVASSGTSAVRRADIFGEGFDSIVFSSARTTLAISPNAGARAFLFRGSTPGAANWFTTVGGLRDDVAIEPSPSSKDRIAKYTHDFPAGTFNRTYAVSDVDASSARFAYVAPDVIPYGATFDRTITLASGDATGFDLDERADFDRHESLAAQRGVSVTSFAFDPESIGAIRLFAPDASAVAAGTIFTVSGDGFAVQRDADDVLVVAWHAGDIEHASLAERVDSIVARLTIATGVRAHVLFRIARASDATAALATIESDAQNVPAQVTPSPARTP